MALMDEFKEEREKIKNASPEKKWKYFKDYYLKWVIAIGIIILVLIIFTVDMLTKKENMLTVCFVNMADRGGLRTDIEDVFMEQYLENPKKQEITIETGMYLKSADTDNSIAYNFQHEQRFSMLLMAGELDLNITEESFIMDLAKQEYVVPLAQVFTEEELKVYEDQGRVICLGDVPVAIDMSGSALIKENLEYKGKSAENATICAAFSSLKRLEMAKKMLRFLDK